MCGWCARVVPARGQQRDEFHCSSSGGCQGITVTVEEEGGRLPFLDVRVNKKKKNQSVSRPSFSEFNLLKHVCSVWVTSCTMERKKNWQDHMFYRKRPQHRQRRWPQARGDAPKANFHRKRFAGSSCGKAMRRTRQLAGAKKDQTTYMSRLYVRGASAKISRALAPH